MQIKKVDVDGPVLVEITSNRESVVIMVRKQAIALTLPRMKGMMERRETAVRLGLMCNCLNKRAKSFIWLLRLEDRVSHKFQANNAI